MFYNSIKFPDSLLEDNSIIVTLNISSDGIEFNNKTMETIVTYLDEDYCKGILITGDVLHSSIRNDIRDMMRTLRAIFGSDKKIHLNTNKSLNDIVSIKDIVVDEILMYADTI